MKRRNRDIGLVRQVGARYCCPEAICELLESIALEEKALANLINAEAEKLRAVISSRQTPLTPENFVMVQREVVSMLQAIIKFQILLQYKLEDLLEVCRQQPTPKHINAVKSTARYQEFL
ncbi:MAG TPA: hypothetical protein GX019_04590 [Firmicutes bacterium]|nr:hypothetical protein [Bacillota bacterium]